MQYALQGIDAEALEYIKKTFLSKLDVVLRLCIFVSVGVSEGSCCHVRFKVDL